MTEDCLSIHKHYAHFFWLLLLLFPSLAFRQKKAKKKNAGKIMRDESARDMRRDMKKSKKNRQ